MRGLWQTLFGAALLGVLLGGGCRAPVPPPPPPESGTVQPPVVAARRPVVALKVVERAFEPNRLSLQANVPVTISVDNATAQPHSLVIKDPEGHRVVVVTVPIGQTVEVPFAPTTPGTYVFYCKYALHRTFGEEGTIEVP